MTTKSNLKNRKEKGKRDIVMVSTNAMDGIGEA